MIKKKAASRIRLLREALLFDNRGCFGVVKWLFSASIVLV